MHQEELTPIDICCNAFHIETTFVSTLFEIGLIEIVQLEGADYISNNSLSILERYVHFYYDLDINFEGLEVVAHLLDKMQNLNHEVLLLRNRLARFE